MGHSSAAAKVVDPCPLQDVALEQWFTPVHFPATRSGLIGRAHDVGAPEPVLAALRRLPPDGHEYTDVAEVTAAISVAAPPRRRPIDLSRFSTPQRRAPRLIDLTATLEEQNLP